MILYRFFLFVMVLLSCNNQPSATKSSVKKNTHSATVGGYQWNKIADSAAWKKSYNFQMFSTGDTLWTFHPDGNWYTTDQINWTKSSLPNIINNMAFLDYLYFNNAFYGLGYLEGNIEQFNFKPEIYTSTDGKQWAVISRNSNLPKCFFYHPFVFDKKIWIIGGEDKNTKYDDCWSSTDGINWIQEKGGLPFGKRSGSQVVLLNGTLYLLNNDVWSSTDGLNWQQETTEIVKGENIFGYNAIVFDNKIWLLGCNRNGQFSSQVLVSADGKNWQGQDAPWTPRGGIAATVHKGKIYMTGGKYGGTPNQPDFRYSNDIWTLEKKNQ
jgi:hypothetical protein